jgi:trimethylamine--corrinoid protein Co-methyltransferase
MIRGAGTLEFANVVSKEKLLIDNEICGMARRLVRPTDLSESALALDVIFERATSSDGYLSAPHTFDMFRDEFFFPSALIDRGTRREFEEKGSKDTYARAVEEVKNILGAYVPREVDIAVKAELDKIIIAYAKQFGGGNLPVTDIF